MVEEESADEGQQIVRTFKVTVVGGPDAGRVHCSTQEPVVVGSHDRADLQLTDPEVSHYHLELTPLVNGFGVRDLNSDTGTFAGNVRLKQGTLPLGATLDLGRTRLVVEPAGAVAAIPRGAPASFGRLVGHGPAMARALMRLARAARSDATVLLSGETGTGKELAARSLHEASDRADGPYVVVDCAAVPSTLFEAELFGHERGAFTGALAAREGAFELAHRGTLFIDEIGELSMDLQPKLLRVLDFRETKRIGAKNGVAVDVRVVAATHRDLRAEVNQKRFREDLYYRLAVVDVAIPPLRERSDDLPDLVQALGRELAARMNVPFSPLVEPSFLAELARHDWPGNVRELRNYLERTLVLGPHEDTSTPEGHRPSTDPVSVTRMRLKDARAQAVAAFERTYLEEILGAHDGNVTLAARAAGVDRVHFYRLLWRNGLRRMGSAS